jgi:hypothetical protein
MGRISKDGVPKKKRLEGKDLEISKSIVNCINAEMQKRNIKYDSKLLQEIAEATGQEIEGSRFSLIRNHQTLPNITELNALADYFKITTDNILGRQSNTIKSNDNIAPTAADVLRAIFGLRKITEISFSKKVDSRHPEKPFTAIYFDHSIIVQMLSSDSLSYFINESIEEWEQIINSTWKMNTDTRETILRLWEENKLQVAKDISLDTAESLYKYDILEEKYIPLHFF